MSHSEISLQVLVLREEFRAGTKGITALTWVKFFTLMLVITFVFWPANSRAARRYVSITESILHIPSFMQPGPVSLWYCYFSAAWLIYIVVGWRESDSFALAILQICLLGALFLFAFLTLTLVLGLSISTLGVSLALKPDVTLGLTFPSSMIQLELQF